MKIQYVSDIHLEHRKRIPDIEPLPGCDILVLAGDIGIPSSRIYSQFLRTCSYKWKHTFVLYGNHEFYNEKGNSYTMTEMKKFSELFPDNVFFMDNDVFYVYRSHVANVVDSSLNETPLKIIGSTLWSNITNSVASKTNDRKNIIMSTGIVFNKKIRPKDIRSMFETNKKYIIDNVKSEPNIPVVIVTHHGTHNMCQGYYEKNPLSSGYATHIPELFENRNLVACINGHTHSSIDETAEGGTQLLSNCMGYPWESRRIVCYNPKAELYINL